MKLASRWTGIALMVMLASVGCQEPAGELMAVPQADISFVSQEKGGGQTTNNVKLVPARDQVSQQTGSAVIDSRGGKLSVGGHTIIVPKRAVSEATVFTMVVLGGEYIAVDLTARRVRDNNIVSKFPEPITLNISLDNSTLVNPIDLVVAYLRDGTFDGEKDALPTTVNVFGRTLSTEVRHFSGYAAAIN
jgi:hypothetical protein